MEKLVIIDGHNLLFRMFYGMPNKIYTKDGKCVHGTIGFVGGINKIIKEHEPTSLIVVFDSEEVSAKMEDERYKKNRILNFSHLPDDENPFSQYADILKCLDLLDITHIEMPRQEADDVIGTIAKQFEKEKQVIIVSTDKDFFQLLNENISVFSPRGKSSVLYTPEVFIEKYTFSPSQYLCFKALVGDSSDNIDGVRGIGTKTATSLLTEYNSIDGIYKNLDKLSPRIRTLLNNDLEKVMVNLELLKINCNLDIDLTSHNLGYLVDWESRDIIDRAIKD